MGIFAWRNLLTRPLRTFLALIGLSIPILGILGLFCLSNGLRDLVGTTLSRIEGLLVLREDMLSPVLSHVPASLVDDLRKTPGVRAVAPEVWGLAPPIEGRGMILKNLLAGQGLNSILDKPVIAGQEIVAHQNLRSAVFPRALKENGAGRFLQPGDEGTSRVVISRKIARQHPDAKGNPKKVGDNILIGGKPFEIIGLYETGSMILDVVIVMDIETARRVVNEPKDSVSCIYIEGTDPAQNTALAKTIEQAHPGIDARSMNEAQANFGSLMGQVDSFLLMTVSLALVVGIVGIINTMLMSTTERFAEFGVLRTNGWSQSNILALVTLESAYLGLLAGVGGCLLAAIGTTVINQFVADAGIHLGMTPSLLVLGIGLSVLMGTCGGLYPAWRAARLLPMEAIRLGSR
jgi:putative ABC transport system permease protein